MTSKDQSKLKTWQWNNKYISLTGIHSDSLSDTVSRFIKYCMITYHINLYNYRDQAIWTFTQFPDKKNVEKKKNTFYLK